MLVGGAGCPGDDTTGSSGAGSTTEPSSSSSGSLSASETSATTTTTAADTTAAGSSTGPACDRDACEALDVESCAACDPNDCAVRSGYPWRQDDTGAWCIEGAVPIACQVGSICFDYYLTLCDADGQVYYVDMGCPAFDIEAAGFTECDAPAPLEVSCEA